MWDSIISVIEKVNTFLNDIVWGWPVMILILGTGIILSVRTKFLQVTHFGDSLSETIIPTVKSIGSKDNKKTKGKTISQFEAFSTAISGTVGTGNIIGPVFAILAGGPGAIFWMWVSAFLGMVTNYSENVLGLYFRKKDKDGGFSGGAFYYLENGLKFKTLGKILGYMAAIFCVLAAIGMSGVQTNKITGTITGAFDLQGNVTVKLIVGIVVAILTALIILGGIKRIGKVSSMLVPVMSVLFIVMAFITIFMNITNVPKAFALIFTNAFNFKSAGAGILGYSFSTVIENGLARGVFSNEAGLGSSVIAHSASETKEPVKQGLWGVFEVFFDTFVICTLTALFFLTTIDVTSLTGAESDTGLAIQMFSQNFGLFGKIAICVIMPLFAFTTSVAWSYYGEKAVEYLFRWAGEKGKKISVLVFKILFLLLFIGASVIESNLVWAISDTFNGLMAIPNLVALVCLNGLVAKITFNYFRRKKGEKLEPMLSAYPELNEEFKKESVGYTEETK